MWSFKRHRKISTDQALRLLLDLQRNYDRHIEMLTSEMSYLKQQNEKLMQLVEGTVQEQIAAAIEVLKNANKKEEERDA